MEDLGCGWLVFGGPAISATLLPLISNHQIRDFFIEHIGIISIINLLIHTYTISRIVILFKSVNQMRSSYAERLDDLDQNLSHLRIQSGYKEIEPDERNRLRLKAQVEEFARKIVR